MSKLSEKAEELQVDELDNISRSDFEEKRNREGDWALFYNKEDIAELMGHTVKFYPNGVLLVLKDYAKDYSKEKYPDIKIESQSYIFYNNEPVNDPSDKKPIFEIHNRNKNKETRECYPPTKDINIKVCQHHLYVKELDSVSKHTNEYFIDILTGNKVFDIDLLSQISMGI